MKHDAHCFSTPRLASFATLALLAGCAAPKTVYVDNYRELRPFVTTVLSETKPSPTSQPIADEPPSDDKPVQASATGG